MPHYELKHKMEPAHSVITKIGGVRATARLLGINASAVSRWLTPRKRKGTDGSIPQKHWQTILSYAKNERIKLSVSELSGLK